MPKLRFADRQVYSENRWLEKFHQTAPTCCLFRRSSFDRLGGYRTSLRFAYDWDLFFRFMTGEGVLFLPKVLSVYRKHEQQASQTSSLQGLYDVLDLWKLKEYSYFRSSDVADLVFQHLRMAISAKSSWLDIVHEVRRRGLAMRVLRGLVTSIPIKAWRKIEGTVSATEPNSLYELPSNLDSALHDANMAIGN